MISGLLLKKIASAVLASMIGRIVIASLLGLAALKGYGLYERRQGAKEVVAEINEQAENITKTAVAAREPAFVPGSAQRLKAKFCRDC